MGEGWEQERDLCANIAAAGKLSHDKELVVLNKGIEVAANEHRGVLQVRLPLLISYHESARERTARPGLPPRV